MLLTAKVGRKQIAYTSETEFKLQYWDKKRWKTYGIIKGEDSLKRSLVMFEYMKGSESEQYPSYASKLRIYVESFNKPVILKWNKNEND